MKRPTPAQTEMAQRMLGHDSVVAGSTGEAAAAIYESLFNRLAPLIGGAGVHAIFARSLKLTKSEFPCLADIAIVADSPIDVARCQEHLRTRLSEVAPQGAADAAAGLYGTMLGLLHLLLGEQLVWQIVRSAFPALEQSVSKEKSS